MSQREPQWRPIPGASMYEVSDQGQVRSWMMRGGQGRPATTSHLLKMALSSGYQVVTLIDDNGRPFSIRHVHRLVLLAFRGPRPPGMDSRHANGVRTDNRLSNLNYSTRSQNIRDQIRHGTHPHASKTHCLAGHPFDQANTAIKHKANGRPYRECRECKRVRERARSHAAEAMREVAALLAAETRPAIEVERIRQLIPAELLDD